MARRLAAAATSTPEMSGLGTHGRPTNCMSNRKQVDRLKAEGFQGQTMRDHTRLRAFELAIKPKVVETEKVLNGLIRALRDVL